MLSNLLTIDDPSVSLQQGAAYKRKIKSYKPLNSKEGFDNNTTASIDQLKTDFDQTLVQYSTAYNQYIEDFIKHQDSPTIKYTNHLVSTLTGDKYFINKYGYLRKFATDAAYTARDSTCNGTNIVLDDTILSQIPVGININEKEICGVEGQMIQDTSTKHVSWVDEKGQRHWKDDSVHIPIGCPTNLIGVPDDSYLAMNSGSYFTKSSTCNTSALKDEVYPTLVALNDKLVDLSTKLLNETSTLRTTSDQNYTSASKAMTDALKKQRISLKEQKQKLKDILAQTTTLDATINDNTAIVKSNVLKYMFIAGGTAIVIGYLFKDMFHTTQTSTSH